MLSDLLGGKPLGQRIHGMQRRQRLALGDGLCDGRGHMIAFAVKLHLTVKTELAAYGKHALHVILIDIHDLTVTAVVKRTELDKRHAFTDHGAARLRGNRHDHRRLALPVTLAKTLDVAAVFIRARKMIQKIPHGKHAKPCIRCLLGRTHAAQSRDRHISDVLHIVPSSPRFITHIIADNARIVNNKTGNRTCGFP